MNLISKLSAISLDISKGDILLGGKFKNVPTKVEDIGTDELGQPTINGKKLLAFRIKKNMPQEKTAFSTTMLMKLKRIADAKKATKTKVPPSVDGHSIDEELKLKAKSEKNAGVVNSMVKKLKKVIPPEGEQQYIDFGMPNVPVANKAKTEGVDKSLKGKLKKSFRPTKNQRGSGLRKYTGREDYGHGTAAFNLGD